MEVEIQGKKLLFTNEVLTILDFHKQRKYHHHEKGGIILGKLIKETILINRLSIPTKLDKSSRTNFERHLLSAQIIIDYEFFNSNQQITYLGEWHTHPEDHPTPSPKDMKMIQQQFSQNLIHTGFLILLIQGRESMYIGFRDKHGLHSTVAHL